MSVGRSGAMELMLALFNIVQGTISTIMGSAGFSTPQQTVLPPELITSVEECGFFESIPLWAVTLIGGLFITVMSFILIMTVYGRFFKLYMYTALAPIPLSTFAGEPSQNVGKSFIKSYCAVCLEGAVIVLFCIIFSLFASSPPLVNPDAAAVTADFCKQLFLPRLGVRLVDECDLLAGDSSGDELFPDVVKSPACRTACSPSSAAPAPSPGGR